MPIEEGPVHARFSELMHPLPQACASTQSRGHDSCRSFNLKDRIAEGHANGWLGEVEWLQTSLDAARTKLAVLDRLARDSSSASVNIGMPVIKR